MTTAPQWRRIAESLPKETVSDFANRWAFEEAPDKPRQVVWEMFHMGGRHSEFTLRDGRKRYRIVPGPPGLWAIEERAES